VGSAALEQMAISVLGHPTRTREMGFPSAVCTIGFLVWIDVEHDPRNLPPICRLGLGVEKAEVGDSVLFVVSRQDGIRRG